MPSWPGTLPTHVLVQGYGETPPKLTIESAMEAGPPATRRRFTAGERPIRCRIALTTAQKVTLEAFFEDTLKSGSIPFDWVHPVTRAACVMRLAAPPAFTAESSASFLADLELRVQP